MKKLFIDKVNKLTLDAQFTNQEGMTVTVSIVGENGEPMLDADGETPHEELTAVWDNTLNRYYTLLSFDPLTVLQYARAFWSAVDSTGTEINLEGFHPEDIKIETSTVVGGNAQPQIMPVSKFLDDFIAPDTKLDNSFKQAIRAYINKDINKFRETLLAAQNNLEMQIKMRFFATTALLKRDYYAQDYQNERWIQQFDFSPIVAVTSYKLLYGGNPPIELTSDITQHMVVDKLMGTIEFVPTAVTGSLWVSLLTNVGSLAASGLGGFGTTRVPLLFNIEYRHGLDFPNLPEQEKASIRWAVSRNALMNILPIIDPSVRNPSQSKSVDGASKSQTSGVKDLLKDYREDEKVWVNEYMKQYAKHFDIVVV